MNGPQLAATSEMVKGCVHGRCSLQLVEVKQALAHRQRQLNSVDEIMQSYKEEIHKLEVHQQELIRRDMEAIRTAADDLKLAHSVRLVSCDSFECNRKSMSSTH